MTFRRSSRKELMEFYPERAGAITNVKLFALDAGLALGGVFHRLRYSFCNLVEQGFILSLHHHADQRLGARLANEQTSLAHQRGLCILDSRLHRSHLQRRHTLGKSYVPQHLWTG